jgi:hypothetical protein
MNDGKDNVQDDILVENPTSSKHTTYPLLLVEVGRILYVFIAISFQESYVYINLSCLFWLVTQTLFRLTERKSNLRKT